MAWDWPKIEDWSSAAAAGGPAVGVSGGFVAAVSGLIAITPACLPQACIWFNGSLRGPVQPCDKEGRIRLITIVFIITTSPRFAEGLPITTVASAILRWNHRLRLCGEGQATYFARVR